jgi:polyhydroxyalkanoate synthesis regulator protein
MFKIEDILSGDFSKYPPEAQEYMIKYTEKLREKIKEELAKELADRMLKDVDKSNETFMNILTEILDNGCKGFNKMSTRALLNTYLEKKSQEDFFNLLDQINM